MDEFLSEKEQLEQIREWWRDNGWYLIGGAVVAGVGYLGWGQYRAYQSRQASAASGLYAQMQQMVEEDRPGSDDVLEQLIQTHPDSPYALQARLLAARELVVSDTDRAADHLRAVVNTDTDTGLAMVARVRLARVLAYQQNFSEALGVLDVAEPGEFEAQMQEVRGDILAEQGADEEALRAYTSALIANGAEGLDRTLLQIKMTNLGVGLGAASAGPNLADPGEAGEAETTEAATEPQSETDGSEPGSEELDAEEAADGAAAVTEAGE